MKDILAIGSFFNAESNVIPILSAEDEVRMSEEELPSVVALLPMRNTVLFPGMVIPITVGREKSLRLARECSGSDEPIGVVTQRDSSVEDPTIKDLYRIATLARILKTLNLPDGNVMMVVQGVKVFEIGRVTQSRPYYRCTTLPYPTNDLNPEITTSEEFQAKMMLIREMLLSSGINANSVTISSCDEAYAYIALTEDGKITYMGFEISVQVRADGKNYTLARTHTLEVTSRGSAKVKVIFIDVDEEEE